ncbi:MAG: hypothetical protein ACD_61C00276G0003 [uncultured bacterium]|nr:MAG: hypothetical protein ACD_61C00276G0003 [uncultured bacterium]
MIITKKTWPELFEKLLSGEKTFDCRIADFEVHPGDVIVFKEYDPEKKSYTGRTLRKTITFVGKTKEWKFFKPEDIEKFGYVIMSLK